MATDCIFCKIVSKQSHAQIRFEDDYVIAFDSIEPVAPIHILIVPKEHITSFTDLESDHKEALLSVAKAVKILIDDNNISIGYKVVVNGGKYQSIMHLHWHLLGGDMKEWAVLKT